MAGLDDRIIPLNEMEDFKVADGDPDVRGWEVVTSDRRTVGEVDDLLVDPRAMKVRYLDVSLREDAAGAGAADRHILIPIGYARLDESDDRVFVDRLASADITTLPPYTAGAVDQAYETELRQRFDTDFRADTTDTDFYAHDLYDEDRFYGARREGGDEARLTLSEEQLEVGRRERVAGEVEVDKKVETEHVRETVPVAHEEVVVERRPAAPGMGAKARIEEGEIRVPITEEELVVDKRVVPTEEVVVRKREVVDDETVEADLRRERADVNREGDVDLRNER